MKIKRQILLDYKSERNVTNHSLNRACVLLKLLQHVNRKSKIQCFGRRRRLFSRLFKGSKHGSSYPGQNYIENDLRGNKNWFELSRVRVTEGKITVNV